MELGICVRDIGGRELAELGRFAEDHGFDELYVPDASAGGLSGADGLLTGRDAFTALAAMFAATSTIGGTVGVATLISHHLRPLALAASTLQEQSEGRFSLGVGVSHRELAAVLDVPFPDAPIGFVRNWLAQLRQLSNEGMAFGGGWPVLLGALGPQMTRLGATDADGLVLNWLTPEHAARCVADIRLDAPSGRVPKTVLYVRLMPAEAVRQDAVNYDALANYHRHFVGQGLHGPEAIVAGTTLPLADPGAARARLEQYAESGLDLLCLYPHGLTPEERREALSRLTR